MSASQDAEFLEQVDADQLIDLHRSNLLRLQTSQLLEEIGWQPTAKVLEFQRQVCEFIQNLSNKKKIPLVTETPFASFSDVVEPEEEMLLPRLSCIVVCPHHDHHNNNSTSLLLTTKASGNAQVPPTLQLHVQISNSFFAPKDYLKHRYFDKRNRVVWTVARHLATAAAKDNGKQQQVYWKYQHGDVRKPMLLLQLKQPNKFCRLEITFGMQSLQWIPPLRLVPNRGNLGGTGTTGAGGQHRRHQHCPTPHYNHAVLEDVYGTETIAATTEEACSSSSVQHAAILAKIWCLQRGMLRGHDTLTESHLTVFMQYLLRTKRINPRLTPVQILAAWFKLLVEADWLGELQQTATTTTSSETSNNRIRKAPSEAYRDIITASTASTKQRRVVMVLPLEGGLSEQQTIAKSDVEQLYSQQTRESPLTENDPPTLLELYRQTSCFAAVLLDPTMTFNYLGRWSPSLVRMLQREAQKSLQQFHSPTAFNYLFMTEARFWSRYDAYLRIRLSDILVLEQQQSSQSLWGDTGDDRHDVGDYESIARRLIRVLSLALGDRVHEIRLLTTGNGSIHVKGGHGDNVDTSSSTDSDEIPRWEVTTKKASTNNYKPPTKLQSPTGSEWIVIGFTFNSETCTRMVDRGPPADDNTATEAFLRLWGKKRAQLRRFKDGAIVHAVVWDAVPEDDENVGESPYVRFENDDKLNGGIVERIVRHITRLHFLGNPKTSQSLQFSLRSMLSAVDGVLHENDDSVNLRRFNYLTAHRMVVKAFDSLSQFLRKHSLRTEPVPGTSDLASRLGIPLSIDAVEPLSPALRYTEVFPPVAHPLLGAPSSTAATVKETKIPGAVLSHPIEIQIRFGPSSKWPTDFRAIGAAKSAMLVRIIDGIDAMKRSGYGDANHLYGDSYVTSSYADIGWMGFVFRLRVRADPELKLLRSLNKPGEEASSLLRELTKTHVVSPTHHTMILSIHTSHPSSSAVTRMAKRWLSSHLLSGHFPFEAVELLVASVYSNTASPLDRPGSVVTGFLRFLQLLERHDWAREPLIVDPHGSFSTDDVKAITKQFEHIRGPDFQKGPAMFIISPCDCFDTGDSSNPERVWYPTFTASSPETVVLARAAKLAERSYSFLKQSLRDFDSDDWASAFLESKASFQSYHALLRVSSDFMVDPTASSTDSDLNVRVGKSGILESSFTRTMRSRWKGPKDLEIKAYRNITKRDDGSVILYWNPVDSLVQTLAARLGPHALFFYNDFCPNVIAVLWRPLFEPRAFSAMVSEYARPITADEWKQDTLVTLNVRDMLREISQYTTDIVTDVKVFYEGPAITQAKRKRKQPEPSDESSSNRNSSSSESESDSESSTSE